MLPKNVTDTKRTFFIVDCLLIGLYNFHTPKCDKTMYFTIIIIIHWVFWVNKSEVSLVQFT